MTATTLAQNNWTSGTSHRPEDAPPWMPGALGRRGPGARGVLGMMRVLKAYRWSYLASVAAEWVHQALGVAVMTLTAAIVAAAASRVAASQLLRSIGVLMALVVIRAAAAYVSTLISHRLAFRILAEIRHWVYWAFERSAPGGLAHRRSGDLMARVMTDAEALEVFYAHVAVNVAVAATLPPVLVVLAGWWFGWVVALVLIPWFVATATVPMWMRVKNSRHGARVRAQASEVNTQVIDQIGGLRELLAFGASESHRDSLRKASKRLVAAQWNQAVRSGAEQALINALVGLGVLSVIVVLTWQVRLGSLSTRLLPPAIVMAAAGFQPLLELLNGARVAGILRAAAERLFDVVEQPAVVADDGTTRVEDGEPMSITFRDVRFRYLPDAHEALRGMDLTVNAGETVALVGHSGAGKSTVAHLLLRFADPDHGQICLAGHNLRDLPRSELARLVAYVPQDVFLFHDTLAANLRLGAPSATEEEVMAACEAARVTPILDQLDDGIETVVGERGTRLSGGERQRVAIARALLRSCPVLLLDESSSQLDALAEQEIQRALDRARSSRTTLVIAHRLSTILTADRIVLLDHGQVADEGTHDELMTRSATYAALVHAQQDAAAELAAALPSDTGTPAGDR